MIFYVCTFTAGVYWNWTETGELNIQILSLSLVLMSTHNKHFLCPSNSVNRLFLITYIYIFIYVYIYIYIYIDSQEKHIH